MSVELDIPAEFRKLMGETGIDEVYGTFVYTHSVLQKEHCVGFVRRYEGLGKSYLATTSKFTAIVRHMPHSG